MNVYPASAVRDVNATFETALEGAGTSIWDADLRTGEVFLSAGWAALLGEPPRPTHATTEQLKGLVHPDDLDRVIGNIVRALKGEVESYSEEHRVRTRSGDWKWVHSRGKVVEREAGGRALRMCGTNTDITELRAARERDLSQKKRAEERLQDQLHFMSQLLEAIPSPVFFKDEKGRYLGCNRAFERFMGISREALIGKSVYDIAPKELAEVYFAADRELFERPGSQVYEASVKGVDGSLREVVFSKATFSKTDGSLGGLVGVILDITDRKREERLLRMEHAVTRCLAEGDDASKAVQGVIQAICETHGWDCGRYFEVDKSAGVLRFGTAWCLPVPALERFIEGSRERVIRPGVGLMGITWQSGAAVWSADTRSDPRVQYTVAAGEAGLRGVVVFPIEAEGKMVGVLTVSGHSVREPDARLLQSVSVVGSQVGLFIQRKRAERALRKAEAELRVVADNVPAMIAYYDSDDRLRYANRRHADFLGYALPEGLGRRVSEVIGEQNWGEVEPQWTRVRAGEAVSYERPMPLQSGTVRHIRTHLVPDRAPTGEVAGVYVMATDITEQKSVEELRARQTEELRMAQVLADMVSIDWDTADDRITWSRAPGWLLGPLPESGEYPLFKHMVHEEDREAFLADRDASLRGEREHQMEYRIVRTDGAVRWVNARGRAYRDGGRHLPRMSIVLQDVTERVRAMETLRTVDAELRLILDSVPALIARLDRDARFRFVNRAHAEFLERKPAEIVGRTIKEVLDAADIAVVQPHVRRVLAGERVSFERRRTRGDGTVRWLALNYVPDLDRDGAVIGFYGLHVDITERRRAQEEASLFRSLVNRASDMIEVVDPETGRFLDVNEKACSAHGYSRDELLRLTVPDINPVVALRTWGATLAELRRAGSLVREGEHRRKDGSTFPTESNVTYVRLDRDYVLAIVRDISERRRAELALRARDAELRLVTDHVPALIAFIDGDNRFRYANRTFADFYGGGAEPLEGRAIGEVLDAATAEEVRPFLARARAGESIRYEAQRRRHDGAIRAVDVTLVPNVGEEGAVGGVFTLAVDVTERAEAERARMERARLEAANDELNAFAYTVAHDLRAPLRAIAGFAGLLRESDAGRLSRDGLDALARIEGGARRLHDLIEALLNYARSTAKDLALVEIDLADLVREAVDVLREAYPAASVRIGALPRMLGDRALIWDVLLNLAGNALKFSSKRETPIVEIGSAVTQRGAAVYVRDNGVGFDPAYADRLFGVFQRLHSESEFPGTGIGLAFVRRVLARHGSETWAESGLGEGATFYFTVQPVSRFLK